MTKVDPRELEARELDALVAERLFGWVWLEAIDRGMKAIFPPEDSGWVRLNFSSDYFRPAEDTTERFSDWDQCCRTEDGSQRGLPHYSTDIACAFQVVEKMRERGLGLSITSAPNGSEWRVSFFGEPHRANNGHEYAISMKASLPRAICLAALAALSTTPEE